KPNSGKGFLGRFFQLFTFHTVHQASSLIIKKHDFLTVFRSKKRLWTGDVGIAQLHPSRPFYTIPRVKCRGLVTGVGTSSDQVAFAPPAQRAYTTTIQIE